MIVIGCITPDTENTEVFEILGQPAPIIAQTAISHETLLSSTFLAFCPVLSQLVLYLRQTYGRIEKTGLSIKS